MAFEASTILTTTSGVFVGGSFSDTFTVGFGDVDMVALTLLAGQSYSFDVDNATAGDLYLRIFDAFGNEVRANDDGNRSTDDVVFSPSPYIEFNPNYSGTYYAAVSAFYLQAYDPFSTAFRFSPENPVGTTPGTLTVQQVLNALWPANGSINAIVTEALGDQTDSTRNEDGSLRVRYDGSVDSTLDVDMARMDLFKGDVVVIDVNGLTGNGTVLRIFDDNGLQIGFDDDSGIGLDPELVFTAPSFDDYYIGISGEGNSVYDGLTGASATVGTVGAFEVIVHLNPTQVGSALSQSQIGTEGADYVVALAGADSVVGGDGKDTLAGGDNDDTLNGGTGSDVVYGEGGNDSLLGGQGRDVLIGGIGDDVVGGAAGNDMLEGGSGNDRLFGFANDDTLRGDGGNDVLQGGGGSDVAFGGAGNDTFADTSGNDSAFGDAGDDRLNGLIGDDTLDGGAGNDTLTGDVGNDSLVGGAQDDSLTGNGGTDRLSGGAGADTLAGGNGGDAFVFFTTGEGVDLITDFLLPGNDRIDLSAVFSATGSVVSGATLAQFVQATPAGAGADAFLGVDANGAVGGLSFTIIAQVVGVTSGQLFDVNNFLL